jgi:hypothetical protein
MHDLRKHLEFANRHIADAKTLISQQLVRLGDMNSRGEDTREGEKLLSDFLDSLTAFEAHQRAVLAELMSRGEIHVSELSRLKNETSHANK